MEVESLKAKVRKLQKQLMNNKIFLNMVIHDMRNPTNSIEFALKEVLRIVSGQGAPDPVAAAGAPVRTHSENFRLVAVISFDSLKD
jgi:signal transduction histidine kinase